MAVVLFVLAAFAFAGVPGPSTAGGDPKYSDKKLKKLLKKELQKAGLTPKGISSCKPQSKKLIICKWRAKGTLPGDIDYECAGRAKFMVKTKSWEIDPCQNVQEPMMPLNATAGPPPLFGFNEDWNLHVNAFDDLAAIGANVARQGIFWDAVEPNPGGGYDWSVFDNMYAQWLARGIRPLWVLYAAPCWAQAGTCEVGAHPQEQYYDEMAAWAAEVARRYPQAIGIEVWNEPNFRLYWGGDPDPQSYANMLNIVGPAIKAANPSMPVVQASLSPHVNTDPNAMAYKEFLRQVYETGAPAVADAIGAHPYPNRRFNEDYLGNIRVNLYRYYDVMNSFGDNGKPIWVTETGVSNTGEDESFTPDQQAEALVKIYDLMRRIAYPIPVVIYHRFLDKPNDVRVKEQGYGVLNGNGNRKPAFCAIADARDHPC